jgi:microcystin-dependent protein
MAFWKWSRTATSNATADNTINWAEGMAPSAVNDSARAMMARLAEWRDDVSGTITTAGTSTAYTLASNQGFDNLADMNGAMIAFVPHTTNGATVTLNVDGLGNKPLRFGPSLDLQSGVLIQGTPYVVSYNNSDGAFYLQGGFANPYGIPLGGMMPYIGSSAPNTAFAIPIGQAISRTTYATLFSLVGTIYGAGDGSTTFNVPDLRGRAVFGLDSGGSNRITVAGGNFDGTVLGNAGGAQNQTLTAAQIPAHTHSGTTGNDSPDHTHNILQKSMGDSGFGAQIGGPGTTVSAGPPGNNGSNDGSTQGASVRHQHPFTTDGGTGGGQSHPIMPPAMLLPYILRII